MNNPRLEALLGFLDEEPDDAFTKYAVALEYSKTDINTALKYFRDLRINHPAYIGTYYQEGIIYRDIGEIRKAEEIFELIENYLSQLI